MLTTEERAALATVLLSGGGEGALTRLRGGCLEAWRARRMLSREERARAIADDVLRLVATAPRHLGQVHPSWLEAGLVDEPDAVRSIVADGARAGVDAEVATWLRRNILGELVDMPLSLPGASLLQERLEVLGRRRFAIALQAVPRAAQAQVALLLGPVHAKELVRELRSRASREDVSFAVRELHGLVGGGGAAFLLVRAATRHLAPALANRGDLPRQLAQRLPRDVGRALLAEAARVWPSSPVSSAAGAALESLLVPA